MSDRKYVVSKIDNNTYCRLNGQFTRHLRDHNLDYREYYETYITGFSPLCECNRPLTFYQKTDTYANSCGDPVCVGRTVSNIKQSWSVERKFTDSQNKKAAAALRTPEQKAAKREKVIAVYDAKYGVDRSFRKRSTFSGKKTLPSGNVIRVRGNAPLVLDYLFHEEHYSEDRLITDNTIPVFEYTDVARHILKYYPDVYIPSENRILEVKSDWWWDGNGEDKYKSRLENILRKMKAVVDKGYHYEVWIYKNKKLDRVLKDESDFQAEYQKIQSINT